MNKIEEKITSTVPYYRLDLIFSYWIFAWFLIYMIYRKKITSPIFAIYLGTFVNFIGFCISVYLYIFKKHTLDFLLTIILFTTINFFIKVIPLLVLMNEKIKLEHIIATILLYIIYNIWALLNNRNDMEAAYKVIKNGISDNTPFVYYTKQYIYKLLSKN
jgi:hypothetical protein